MKGSKSPRNNKLRNVIPVLLLFVFLGFSQNIKAQSIDINQAIEIALQNNTEIQSKNLDIKSAQILSKTAFELPKTDLNFQYGNNEGFEYNDGIQISQNIPFPTLFGAKKNLVKEQVRGLEWAKALTENELKRQVRNYYYQLEYLEHNASVLKYLNSIYADFIRIAELRYKTGDIGKLDVNTAITKKGEINLFFQQNEVFRQNAYENLKTLMQTQEDFIIEFKSDYEPLLLSSFMDSSAIENHPRIQLFYQDAKIAEQNKKVERANGLPDFTIGYNNISLIGMQTKNGVEQFYGRDKRFSFFDVGISIPLTFGATKAKVRSLDYQKQSLELNAQWQAQQLKTELTNTLNQYEQYLAQFRYFKEQALPNADEIIQAAQLGYSTGAISYVEYLYALQTTTDIQLNYLKSIQQINETVTLINSLISK